MVQFASGLSALGLRTITFNFLYTEAGRRVPDRAPKLETCYRSVVEWVRKHAKGRPIFIGGKSMGGRMASLVADECGVGDSTCPPSSSAAAVRQYMRVRRRQRPSSQGCR